MHYRSGTRTGHVGYENGTKLPPTTEESPVLRRTVRIAVVHKWNIIIAIVIRRFASELTYLLNGTNMNQRVYRDLTVNCMWHTIVHVAVW